MLYPTMEQSNVGEISPCTWCLKLPEIGVAENASSMDLEPAGVKGGDCVEM
jgi:hypothetical protein